MVPAPTTTCAVQGDSESPTGFRGAFFAFYDEHSPASTRNASCEFSAWYRPFGWPGWSTLRLTPTLDARFVSLEAQTEPQRSECIHSDSRAFKTNQPSPFGRSPCWVDVSVASGTLQT